MNNQDRTKILEKGNYICRLCKKCFKERNDLLHIHHKDLDTLNNNDENLIILCRDCHIGKIHLIKNLKKPTMILEDNQPKENFLTKRQILFLEYAKEKKVVTIIDIKKFYTTQPLAQFKRLIELGYLKENPKIFGKFIYTGKEFKK